MAIALQDLRHFPSSAQRRESHAIYEATGTCHSVLERALGGYFLWVKVNPLQARRFAQAQGVRIKTDAVDTRMLAVMWNTFALGPDETVTKIQQDLKELRAFCSGLIKDRTDIMSRMKTQAIAVTRHQDKARLAQVDKQIAEINVKVGRLIHSNRSLAHSMRILRSIPGIGAVCAATILIEMLEIGSMDRKQVASSTGLAPMTHDPDLSVKYQAMIRAGKPRKVALTALMRKLIELVNTLIKADRNWVKKELDQDGYFFDSTYCMYGCPH